MSPASLKLGFFLFIEDSGNLQKIIKQLGLWYYFFKKELCLQGRDFYWTLCEKPGALDMCVPCPEGQVSLLRMAQKARKSDMSIRKAGGFRL